ncbi:MAG: 16S rRNA (adenine(1518)-N(6)/adenine(1519)-N(6))-dimethyltransferase RsmA [Aggregatilineales bacterium]
MNPREQLNAYDIQPRKTLGQNFMHDPNTLEKLVSTAEIMPEDVVVEIGPGTGALTAKLAEVARHVMAIELDDRLMPLLEDRFSGTPNVYFVWKDVLQTDILSLVGTKPYRVVANVPYYITGRILWHVLNVHHRPRNVVITMQYEVAERLTAEPGNMSIPAVMVQYYGKPRIVTRLKPAVFWPRPEINSAILQIDTYDTLPVTVSDEALFFRIVKAGFSQKRKQLRNSLSGGLQIKGKVAKQYLDKADIDSKRRAETLHIEEWARLTEVVAAQSK